MTPDEALQRQIELYRGMTGEERVQIALEMHEQWCNSQLEVIRRRFPMADESEMIRRLRECIAEAREIERPPGGHTWP